MQPATTTIWMQSAALLSSGYFSQFLVPIVNAGHYYKITSARFSSTGETVGAIVGAAWHKAKQPTSTIQKKSTPDIVLKCFLLSINSQSEVRSFLIYAELGY